VSHSVSSVHIIAHTFCKSVLPVPPITSSGGSNAVTKEGHKTISNIDASHTNDTECTLVLSGSSLTALFRSPRITPKPQYAANMCTKREPPASTAPSRNSKRNHSKNIYDGTKRTPTSR